MITPGNPTGASINQQTGVSGNISKISSNQPNINSNNTTTSIPAPSTQINNISSNNNNTGSGSSTAATPSTNKQIKQPIENKILSPHDLKYSSIFYFRYLNPSTKNIQIWDTAPIVIPLLITARHMLAINLHWIRPQLRNKFITLALKLSQRAHLTMSEKTLPRVYLNTIKNSNLKFGMQAIRRYHLSRIAQLHEIPPNLWPILDPSYGKFKPQYRILKS